MSRRRTDRTPDRLRALRALLALLATGLLLAAPAGAGAAPGRASAAGLHRACAKAAPGHVRCFAQWRTPQRRTTGTAAGTAAGAAPDGYGPADVQAAYRLPADRGSGSTAAVVDAYDNPRAEADLAVYRKRYGLPPCTTANGCFRKVNQRGRSAPLPEADPGWGLEIALDLDAVSAACPRCRLLLVEGDAATLPALGAAVDTAVRLGADVVTNSYGTPEFNGMATAGAHYAHPGVAVLASSGDDGFQAAQFPAVLRSVVAVGGTSLRRTSTGWTERAWAGSGSGCSAYVAKPAWQTDRHCRMRTVSDVSAVADPDTGLAVYDTYGLGPDAGWLVTGGTSASSPLVAGMVALAGNAAQLPTAQYLYAHRAGLRDVVGGSNGYCGGDYLCTALSGYDAPTGLGSPRGLSGL